MFERYRSASVAELVSALLEIWSLSVQSRLKELFFHSPLSSISTICVNARLNTPRKKIIESPILSVTSSEISMHKSS